MNRVPLLLAETVKRGAVLNPVLLVAAGVVVAIVGGVLIARTLHKKHRQSSGRQKSTPHQFDKHKDEPQSVVSASKPSDFDVIRKLPPAQRNLFPANLGCDFTLKPGWLFDNVLASRLEGDERKFDCLLSDLISASNGLYKAAAEIGDVFDCDTMITASDMPADLKVSKVYHRGLIRVSTGEVLIAADVA